MTSRPLKRILGTPTALLIGMGVAIGSGIFRTPGEVANSLQDPRLLIAAWILGGLIVLVQGLVTAELATRYPKAGGEYVFLREAYGEFPAFFFGWCYTIFIIGGGAATIASAFGDFACELLAVAPRHSGIIAAGAILAVLGINAAGLRAGATAQNVLTSLKIGALIAIVVIGFSFGEVSLSATIGVAGASGLKSSVFLLAVLSVLFSYDGTTDSVKMAEEIKDVRHAVPRAVIGSSVALIVLYVAVNVALMRVVPLREMAGLASVPGEAMGRLFGDTGRKAMLLVAMCVCLGSLGSTVLATVRVTFALARDGLTFRFMARMSKSQAPVPALAVVAFFAVILVLIRDFGGILKIYYFAAAVLFGLSYASLIVFRLREASFPASAFRCPLGMWLAGFLILLEIAIAAFVAYDSPRDAMRTGFLFVAVGLLYFVWKMATSQRED